MREWNIYFKHTASGPNNIDKPFKTCGRKEGQETKKIDKKEYHNTVPNRSVKKNDKAKPHITKYHPTTRENVVNDPLKDSNAAESPPVEDDENVKAH